MKPDQTLVEITPGGGWYSELLAPLLNDNGHYTAAIVKPGDPAGEAVSPNPGIVLAIHPGPVMASGETLVHIGLDPREV